MIPFSRRCQGRMRETPAAAPACAPPACAKEATEIANTISAYDVLLMIAHAIETAGVAEGPAIKEAIENTKNLQVTHFNWTVDKETHNLLNKPGSVFEAKNGKLVFLEQWKPEGAPVK